MIDDEHFWQPNYQDYCVIDIETGINAPPVYKFPGDPRYHGNTIVVGCTLMNGYPPHYFYEQDYMYSNPPDHQTRIVVGHNVKFDFQYLPFRSHLCWDTGIAHHILSGHKAKMPSLNEVAAHYGLGTKVADLSLLWDIGFKTEDMDPEFLKEYVTGDVRLTDQVYQKQLQATKDTPMTRLLIMHCSMASFALGDAEMTGLPMDVPKLRKMHHDETYHANKLVQDNHSLVRAQYELPPGTEVELTPKMLGKVLHGEDIELETLEAEPRTLKSGKVAKKRRIIRTTHHAQGLGYCPPPAVHTATGAVQVNEEVLALHKAAGSQIAANMLEIRGCQKLTQTYTGPSLTYMDETGFGAIHTKFNQTVTNTGRTSSSAPNVQNLPPEIEACIKAPAGMFLVKADFAQLQMCGIAMLSGDEQLINDINNDVDIHYETGRKVYGWKSPLEMEKATRRKVKNVNFGLIFHGSPHGLSAQTGVEVETVKLIINAFKARYPKAYQYGKDVLEQAKATARPSVGEFVDGHQRNEAFTMTPSGRLIRFVERAAPAWLAAKTKKYLSFSPNEVANYPVQGYSDGDLAIQFLALMYWNSIRIINLVHDSYWFLTDTPNDLIVEVRALLDRFNKALHLRVPLKLDFTIEDSNGNKIG